MSRVNICIHTHRYSEICVILQIIFFVVVVVLLPSEKKNKGKGQDQMFIYNHGTTIEINPFHSSRLLLQRMMNTCYACKNMTVSQYRWLR